MNIFLMLLSLVVQCPSAAGIGEQGLRGLPVVSLPSTAPSGQSIGPSPSPTPCFTCPYNSQATVTCPESMLDCQCKEGMKMNKDEDGCECLLSPENGWCAHYKGCSSSFSYCGCNDGYFRFPANETCVTTCPNGYQLDNDTCVAV